VSGIIHNHPAVDLFPMMSENGLATLAKSIQQQGLTEAIIMHEGLVLDGRNRVKACGLAGIEPRFIAWDGSGGSATMFVVSQQLNKRTLRGGQLAVLAVEIIPLLKAEVMAMEASGLPIEKSLRHFVGRAVRAVGVSWTTKNKALAIKTSDPVYYELIKNGVRGIHIETVKTRDDNIKTFAAGIGGITGYAESIARTNKTLLVDACSTQELLQWKKKIDAIAYQLKTFTKELQGEQLARIRRKDSHS